MMLFIYIYIYIYIKNNILIIKILIFIHLYIYTLYCQKYWVTPSNERFDYFSNIHEYKS